MRSDDIKVLKIKPIKQSVLKDQKNGRQDFFLTNKSTFFLNENSHFFKNDVFSPCFLMQKQLSNQNNDLKPLSQSEKVTLNLDNPDALKTLHNQINQQRLDKVKLVFNENSLLENEENLSEPPIITKNINLTNFNNKSKPNNVDFMALKKQARIVAQKIMQNKHQELKQAESDNISNKQPSESKPILGEHFSSFTKSESLPKKNVLFTQSYTKPSTEKQFDDETTQMEWDITKRPNLNVEQTTNKYYHQEGKDLKDEKNQIHQKETSRIVELEEIDGTYQNDNFYTKLFNSRIKDKPLNQKLKSNIHWFSNKRAKHFNNKELKRSDHLTTMFSNNYQVKQLLNGRQRITKIKKNNIIKWQYLVVLIARIMAIIGLIGLWSVFLLFNDWINNSTLDLYNFFEIKIGKFNFIPVSHHYFLVNRNFMLVLIGIYTVTIILPFCFVSNFKAQLYCFLPLGLLFLGVVIAIAIYSYFFMNSNFIWTSNIIQIISYSFLLLANILMLIGILKIKKRRL